MSNVFKNNITIFTDRVSNHCLLSGNKFTKCCNFLLLNNYSIVNNIDNVNLVILDLCGVFDHYIDNAKEKIDLYLSLNKKVIVIGCISNILKIQYSKKIFYIDTININKIQDFFEYKISYDDVTKYNNKNLFHIFDTDFYNKEGDTEDVIHKETVFILISDGCSFNCTFCNKKRIKGNTKSIKSNILLEEIKREVIKGKKDIYLLSDDCGSYGVDIGLTFPKLLNIIIEEFPEINIFISNIHPALFIKQYNKIKKHIINKNISFINVPIQHTSKRILELMKRPYNIEELLVVLKDIRSYSKVKLWNNIIYDYHKETLEEFINTFKLLKYFNKTIYIKYSDINKIYGKSFISIDFTKKIYFLKKIEHKYNINIIYNMEEINELS